MVKYRGTIYNINITSEKKPDTVLKNSWYSLMNSKKLNIAYFGGSVTGGFGASSKDKCWASLLTQYFKNKFPSAKIEAQNSAIGGTGSIYGAYRAAADMKLESYKPDLVFLEFAINDLIDGSNYTDSKRYMETIIRTVYSYSPNADIVIIFITGSDLKGEDFDQLKAHREIAQQYKIPCINVGKELCAEMAAYYDMNYVDAKSQAWLDYFNDTVHPNDKGYSKYASYIMNYFDKIFYEGRKTEKPTASYMPEKPLTEVLVNPEKFNAAGKSGINDFTVSREGYLTTEKDGAKLTVSFKGTSLRLWCWASSLGVTVEYSIDGGEVKTIQLVKNSDPNHKIFTIAENLSDSKHTVKMTFKRGTGSKADIRYFLISGKTAGKEFSVFG